jgi:hypothetical protein
VRGVVTKKTAQNPLLNDIIHMRIYNMLNDIKLCQTEGSQSANFDFCLLHRENAAAKRLSLELDVVMKEFRQ